MLNAFYRVQLDLFRRYILQQGENGANSIEGDRTVYLGVALVPIGSSHERGHLDLLHLPALYNLRFLLFYSIKVSTSHPPLPPWCCALSLSFHCCSSKMRFDTAFTALVSSATFMGYAHAEEAEAAADATVAIEKPTFTVSSSPQN